MATMLECSHRNQLLVFTHWGGLLLRFFGFNSWGQFSLENGLDLGWSVFRSSARDAPRGGGLFWVIENGEVVEIGRFVFGHFAVVN